MDTEPGSLNLTPRRGPSIWDDARWNAPGGHAIGRWLLGVGGGALIAFAATRGSTARRVMSAAGAIAALSAASGYVGLGRPRAWVARVRRHWAVTDRVGEDSELSFPASDAPAWTPTTGTGTPGR